MYGIASLDRLTELLTRLPGVGRRTARRLVFFLLNARADYCQALGQAIAGLHQAVRSCSGCGNFSEGEHCPICADPRRNNELICVVASPADLVALEQTGTYQGRYHVLGGLLAPLDGVGPEDLRTEQLVERLAKGGCVELILATPLSVEGEATANYVAGLARSYVEQISRIAAGVPHGEIWTCRTG